ncbi:MAG: glycosyltransferase family 4 protein [Actinomycetota bacterium]|nr:glycosyltransferase family 4 protein [Actinomycetota bacterium]
MVERTDNPKNIAFLVSSFWGVAWYRCHVPGVELKRRGHNVVMTDRLEDIDVDACDIFVALRQQVPKVLEVVQYLNAMGRMTVADIDDDYWNLAPDNPARLSWNPEMLERLADIARACQVATTTTPELAEILRRINPATTILPNMLPDEHWAIEPKDSAQSDRLVLGWGGSTSHRSDVRMVGPVLVQLLDEFPELELHLAGAEPDWVPAHPRIRFVDTVPIEQYAHVLQDFDIAVAPLVDTRFNRCKSDLKYMEYAMLGLPVVASAVEPYTRTIRHGENGFLVKNTKGWLKSLRALIRDAELRHSIGSAGRVLAETRLMSRNIERWEKVYRIEP